MNQVKERPLAPSLSSEEHNQEVPMMLSLFKRDESVCCPGMQIVRDWFPLVPFVVPILFPLLPMLCIMMKLHKIASSLQRIESLLDETLGTMGKQK
jgi:hypothetical protein